MTKLVKIGHMVDSIDYVGRISGRKVILIIGENHIYYKDIIINS